MRVCVLGIDPGFAACGLSVVELLPYGERVLEVRVARTQKALKKQNVLASNDNFRRSRELAEAIALVVSHYEPKAIAAESMSFPRSSSTAAKMAMCWGILSFVSLAYNLPLVQATPQQIKKAVSGRRDCSKVEVQELVEKRYSGAFDTFKNDYPTGCYEHGFDATAAVVACLDSEVFRMARGMACEESTG